MVKTTSLSSAAINALTTGDSSILYNNQSRDLVLYSGSLGFSQSGVFNLEINNINGECLKLKYNSSPTNYIDFNITSTGQLNIIPNGADKIVNIYHHNGSTSGLSLGGTLVTASASELNKLDGLTATTTELNYVDTTQGIAEASKALIVDANRDISNIRNLQTENLTVNGTLVTSSATELNYNDITTIGTAEPGKALVADVNRDISNIRNLELTNNLTITNHNGINKGLILGNELVSATASEINILDGVTATTIEINKLAGVTASTSEINKLAGVTATTSELNYVDTTPGTVEASKAVIVDANRDISNIRNLQTENLTVNGTLITASASELNYNDLATIGTAEAGKALVVDINRDISNIRNLTATNLTGSIQTASQTNITSVGTLTGLSSNGNVNIAQHNGSTTGLQLSGTLITANASELNVLDGITSSTEELNILDGVTATANEINVLDGITASTAELNILDGVTATYAEINVLDGITATTTELNYVDTTPGTAEASKALVVDTNKDISGINSLSVTSLLVNGSSISTNGTTPAELTGITPGTASGSKALVVDANKDITSIRNLTSTGLTTTNLTLGSTAITATGTEINKLTGVTATTAEINYNDLTTGPGTAEASKVLVVDANKDITSIRNLTATNLTGTLQTAVQTNITSVGTLTGLTSSGAISITNTTASTSSSTGALTIAGGVGVGGVFNTGGALSVKFNNQSQSYITYQEWQNSLRAGGGNIRVVLDIAENGFKFGTVTNHSFNCFTNNISRMTISNSGDISISNTTTSSSTTTGALIITGGVGIGGTLNVGGNITGTIATSAQTNITSLGTLTGLTSSGVISITNTTASTNTTTGALTVAGGMGIGGATYISGALSVTGNITGTLATASQPNITTLGGVTSIGASNTTTITGTLQTATQTNITSVGTLTGLTSSGAVSITNTTASSSTSTGALTVSGGVGIGGALNVGGSVSFNDNTLRLNNNISSNNNDSGLIIPLYQVDNNTGAGDIVSGEATEYTVGISGVTNNSLTLIAPIGTTLDYYKDWWIRVISSTSGVNNQVRQVTAFDHTTNTITLSSNFANNPVPNLSPVPGTTDSVNLYINRTSVASVWRGNGGFFGNIYTTTDSSTSLNTSSYANTRSSIATVDTLVVNTKKISFSVTGGGVSSYPLQTLNNAFLRFTNGRQLGMNYDGNDMTMQWGAGGGYSQIRVSIGSSGFNTSLPTSITNTTVSSSSTTGALTVAGGMGINGALNIGDAVNIGGSLIVNNITTIIGTLNLTSTANNTTSYNIYQSWSNPATTAVECDMYINNTDVEFGTSTNHTLKLITNDTARLIITNSGNIGIENTSPSYKLDVSGDINLTGSLRFSGIALTSTITELNYLDLSTGPGTAEASKAIILDSNRDITNIRNLTATTLTGTLQTAAQTNITSVGTLTGLTSSGAVSITTSGSLNVNGVTTLNNLAIGGSRSLATWSTGGAIFKTVATTLTDTSTVASGDAVWLAANTFAATTFAATNTNVTVGTGAVNLYVNGPPSQGTNMTFTRSYALYVNGNMYMGSNKSIRDWNMGIQLNSSGGLVTDAITPASNTISTFARTYQFDRSTFAATNTSVTLTNAATVYINDAPNNGTNMTITNKHALYIANGKTTLADTTSSTSSTTGALIVAGGVGIGGATNIGGILSITNTTASTNTLSGALTVAGGVGIGGRLNINDRVNIEGALSITPTTKSISTYSVDGLIWHTNQDRYFGMRQIDNDSLALCWAGGGIYNDKIVFSESSGTTFNTAVTMTRGILEVAGTRTANNYDFGIIGKRFQELENSSPTGDVVTDTANETYTTSTYNNTTPTITLPSPASTTTNFYQNWWIQILSGTGAGQVRKVSSSNSSRVLTLSGGAFTTPLSGSITIGLYAKEFAGIIWDESDNQFVAAHTVTDTLTSNQLTITGYTDFKAKNISINSLALNDTSNYRTLIDCGATASDKIIGLFNDGGSNFYGFGASSSTLRIQTSGGSGGNVSFYTASTSSTLGTERMRIDATKVSILQTTASTNTTSGALIVSGGVGIAGDTWIGGDIVIGTSGAGPNELRFAGTTGDTTINHSVITERIYSGTEKSELLLFKGNDIDSTNGPDRIRLRGSELVFQVHNNETYDTLGDDRTVLYIGNNQVALIGKTTTSNTSNWLEVAAGASGYSALFDGRVGIGTGATNPSAPLHVKGSTAFTLPASTYGYYGAGSTNGSASGSQSISARFEAAIQVNSAVYVSSDSRIKSNIMPIEDNYSKNFILKLDPKKYKLDSEEYDNLHFGYIAQDLIKHGYDNLINLVEDSSLEEHIDNTGFKSPKGFKFQISYSEIIPILAKNIKILYQENSEQQNKINILEQKNNELETQIENQNVLINEIMQRLSNLENN